MDSKKNIALIFLSPLLFVLLFLSSCGPTTPDGPDPDQGLYVSDQTEPSKGDWVIVHLRNDPDVINPFLYRQGNAAYVMQNLFQSLIHLDPSTEEMVPVLAKSKPEISEDGLEYTFEIRDEANWPNGDPITGHDVEFSVKVFKNPNVDAGIYRAVYGFLTDVKVDPNNPKRVTFITEYKYFLTESSVADIWIIPRYNYDPDDLMGPFTVKQLHEEGDSFKENPQLKAFADLYHDEKYSRQKGFVIGSGPYYLEEWVTGQTVKLKRNENWWCDNMSTEEWHGFRAYPEMIVYKFIKDATTAVQAVKNQEVDVMINIPAKEFVEMRDNPAVMDHYELSTPSAYLYSFLGMNNCPANERKKFFNDKRVRRAMAHSLDIDLIIDKVYYGFGERIAVPILPQRKDEFHDGLAPISFDLTKAAALLEEAGWIDTNEDGIRDKEVDGERIEFEFELLLIAGIETADKIALIFQEALKKIGVKMIISSQDFQTCSGRYRSKDYDMFSLAFGANPIPTDLTQIWHTDSWTNASNYFCFGNGESDALIDKIKKELDPAARTPMYHEFQEMVYEDQPIIFVMFPKEKIAIHKRFRNANSNSVRPGFQPQWFWTPKEHIKFNSTDDVAKEAIDAP